MAKKKEVSLMSLEKPEFISLVEKPANQTGFKVIRNQSGADNMAYKDRNRRTRVRKRSDKGLLAIEFPEGVSREDAEEIFDSFGLGEDYILDVADDGTYYARRTTTDAESISGTPVSLGNGYTAYIAEESISRSDNTIAGVTLVGLEFDENFSEVGEVKAWLEEREIQCSDVEEYEGGFAVQRHEVPDKTEVRKVRLDVGVTGVVAKTKDTDVPVKVYRSVIEQSYGNWGWGHISFATALADPAFTDATWDAIYVLRDVLENIILYSGLPLDDRKTLAQNACDQFTVYISGLIDSLPRGVMEMAKTSDRKSKQETEDMTRKTDDKDTKKRSDASAEDKQDQASQDAKDTTNEPEYVTRADLAEVVSEAVKEAMESYEAKRSDDASDDDAASDDKGADSVTRSDDPVLQAIKDMGEQMKQVTESVTTVTRSVEKLKEEVDELAGDTVARSDDDDEPSPDEGDNVKRSDSPFAGMFGSRFGR